MLPVGPPGKAPPARRRRRGEADGGGDDEPNVRVIKAKAAANKAKTAKAKQEAAAKAKGGAIAKGALKAAAPKPPPPKAGVAGPFVVPVAGKVGKAPVALGAKAKHVALAKVTLDGQNPEKNKAIRKLYRACILILTEKSPEADVLPNIYRNYNRGLVQIRVDDTWQIVARWNATLSKLIFAQDDTIYETRWKELMH